MIEKEKISGKEFRRGGEECAGSEEDVVESGFFVYFFVLDCY
ncbi:hypothetical protein COLO4_24807 [Corchorus olitorius]|uniref:Uncharacterized protein n=1 Tax=Corchorus olitorius TaxID=93759 RepID=A0A1R3I6J8_9ROSI|nr:hypothetical protein COLO4_24807 [Corchorus olitorius]